MAIATPLKTQDRETNLVADQNPALAGVPLRPVREIPLDADRPPAFSMHHQVRDRGCVGDQLGEQLFRFDRRYRFERVLRQDYAHAHQNIGDGDQPEPAEIRARDDADVPGPPAAGARHTGEVREHRDVGERGLVDLQVEATRDECRPSRRIDEHTRAKAPGAVTGTGGPGRLVRIVGSGVRFSPIDTGHRHTIGIKRKIGDAMLLANIRAASGRVPSSRSSNCSRGTCQVCGCGASRRQLWQNPRSARAL